MRILAGDIGGTKTVLALYERQGARLRGLCQERFAGREFSSFAEILHRFLAGAPDPRPRVACFGVAGPVIDGRCQTTNLPWSLDEIELAEVIGAERVQLLNDLEATAYGCLHLEEKDFIALQPGDGSNRTGNVAVIAAGTGLGEAMLYWDGQRHHPVASEGGHCDFAPRAEREWALWRYLRERYGHVSYERVVSGPGLLNLHDFLLGDNPAPEWRRNDPDPSATLTRLALSGDDPIAAEALELFVEVYGAEAGNLALKCVAVGGVYVAGGIAPRILPALQNGRFVRAFVDKGRFADLLRTMPIRVVLKTNVGLIGAAYFALRMAP